MGLRDFVIGAWSWLSYKPVMAVVGRPGSRESGLPGAGGVAVGRRRLPGGSGGIGGVGRLPPQELRRLAAYQVLAAYDNNQAGQLSPDVVWDRIVPLLSVADGRGVGGVIIGR